MAGLLYLPRLFVYHAMVEAGSVRAETFKLMERRLLKAIMNPAMIASWGFGLAMFYVNPTLFSEIWMIIKIACIIAMTAAHMVFGKMRKDLENDNASRDSSYRIWNEVPTILMIIIVIMAVVEPI
jgi:putative membrane protein